MFLISATSTNSHQQLHPHLSLFPPDGQENAGKCPHQDSEGSDSSFTDLSNGTELKSPHKADSAGLNCNGAGGGETLGTPSTTAGTGPKAKAPDSEKKHPCCECGQAFRTRSYLNKHLQRVHGLVGAGKGLGDLSSPSLSSPFSPQQNMSLLESFGFQIVQSAFASSLVDSDGSVSGLGALTGGK